MATFDRELFFDAVRISLFNGKLTQQQVDGMDFKLGVWERSHSDKDLRWLAYALATSMHETASTMWPIEEYGGGEGQPYGEVVPETGHAYYGRGDVQLTWDYNYKNASARLSLGGDDDLYWNPDSALDPVISADVMFAGMMQAWFRQPHCLEDYFNDQEDDPYNAREIINGDKDAVPAWSGGVSIGDLIAGYYEEFHEALGVSMQDVAEVEEVEAGPAVIDVWLSLELPPGMDVKISVNGKILL